MNTVGKILVILNFLFAVIVGALLVVDVALRNQWKDKYEQLAPYANAVKHSNDTNYQATKRVVDDFKRAKLELEQTTQKIKDNEVAAKVIEDTYIAKLTDLESKLVGGDVSLKQTLAAKQRLTNEIALLYTTVKEREGLIVKLEADVKTFRLTAQNFEAIARTRQIQNENLLEQLREATISLVKEKSGVNREGVKVVNPKDANPPAVLVNGKVQKVEGNFMEISLGTDHGVNKDNTLDVYRLTPEPKWIGVARIVEADHHSSVARLIPAGNPAFRMTPKAGDLVTSKLSNK
jgi:hypothetical protein